MKRLNPALLFTLALPLFLTLILNLQGTAQAETTQAQEQRVIPVCSTAVALRFRSEVNLPGKPDKYKHCSLSCVMTLYCGPMGSLEVGALKELYDALGFGTPDIEDLRADIKGIKAGLKIGMFGDRDRCYQACSALFP